MKAATQAVALGALLLIAIGRFALCIAHREWSEAAMMVLMLVVGCFIGYFAATYKSPARVPAVSDNPQSPKDR